MDDDAEFEGMPKRRTVKGQFKKGYSGNPGGRPRTKHQRAVSSRQYRRDVLAVTEEIVTVRTPFGVQKISFNLANLLNMRAKAVQGHGPSQRYLDKAHHEAILAHEEANPRLTKLVERGEENAINKSVDSLSRWEWRDLNLVRKYSWRL